MSGQSITWEKVGGITVTIFVRKQKPNNPTTPQKTKTQPNQTKKPTARINPHKTPPPEKTQTIKKL